MNREQAKEKIKRDIPCTDFLQKAPNYSAYSQTGYCCPHCGSGTHGHKDKNTGREIKNGAVEYYPGTNTWHCHACGNGGDVIDAYTETTGADYNEALSYLAARAGITIDNGRGEKNDRAERAQSTENKKQDKDLAYKVKTPQNGTQSHTEETADYTEYYIACCRRRDDPEAVSYLQARGISTETARRYDIGFDPAADPASAPGAMTDENKRHPAPRIIAPCTEDFYIARSIDPSTPEAFKAPNPKGSHTQLFNAAALYNADIVFITEGIFDALSFLEAGQAAVSLNGKGNGKLLLQQLQEKPTAATMIICHDNDDSPETAADTIKQAEDLNRQLQGMNLKSSIYNVAGQYHDANDALQHDRPEFEKAIAAAIRETQRDDLTDFLEKISTEAYKPYKTGLNFFDNLLGGGIIQQSLLLLMASSGTGKTTLAQQIAETMAKERKPVIYFNFEMSREQMLAKAISAKLYKHGGNKNTMEILQGYSWTETERTQIQRVIDEYRREIYPYIKYNPANISSDLKEILDYLTATGEKAKAQGQPAPAAVIDYLHLITSREKIDVQELIKQAITGLKQYAIKYNTFVIAIIAVNRDAAKKGKLTLSSGRDSSNLEYTADYQLSLNHYKVDKGKIDAEDTERISELQQAPQWAMILRVLKNRFDRPGKTAEVLFDAAHNIFYGTSDEFIPADALKLFNGKNAFNDIDEENIMMI